MYSGRQPAMTALIATFSATTTGCRPAISPSGSSPRSAAPASISAIDFSVGGTTGSPSVQPRSKYASIRLAGSGSAAGDMSVSYRAERQVGVRLGIALRALIGSTPRRYHDRVEIDDLPVKTRRWTRREYERLVDQEIFRDDARLELLGGLVVVREPQGSRHGAAIAALSRVFARAFGDGFHVRPQLPIALDDASEPEPDIVVVRGGPWDYVRAHPSVP